MAVVHVVGAGVAGLAAAVRLARAGRAVRLYEAASTAGGRARSYFDTVLERRIDNGNHLLLAGNRSAMAYLAETGAAGSLMGPDAAEFPFVDLVSGARWCVRPNAGPLPWWIWCEGRRVPGSRARDYLGALGLARADHRVTVVEVFGDCGIAYRAFWEPLAIAMLNTEADAAAACLLWPVMREIFLRGASAARPLIARAGLSESFVDPALRELERRSVPVAFGNRLKALEIERSRVRALEFGDRRVDVTPNDSVLLAVPPATAGELVPKLEAPSEFRPIVNAHFVLDRPPPMPNGSPILGILGGTAQWLFARGTLLSVTVSAAGAMVDRSTDDLAVLLWRDVAAALELGNMAPPPHRIVKERRATFAQTPDQIGRRPKARSIIENIYLAGDWTDTGLPATIEGAIRSGHRAAETIGAG